MRADEYLVEEIKRLRKEKEDLTNKLEKLLKTEEQENSVVIKEKKVEVK